MEDSKDVAIKCCASQDIQLRQSFGGKAFLLEPFLTGDPLKRQKEHLRYDGNLKVHRFRELLIHCIEWFHFHFGLV